MRTAKLGELAAIGLVAAICLSYDMMSRAQPFDSASAAGVAVDILWQEWLPSDSQAIIRTD